MKKQSVKYVAFLSMQFKRDIQLRKMFPYIKTVRKCAKEIKISSSTFSRVQNGKMPDVKTLALVCNWLQLPITKYFLLEK